MSNIIEHDNDSLAIGTKKGHLNVQPDIFSKLTSVFPVATAGESNELDPVTSDTPVRVKQYWHWPVDTKVEVL